MPSPFVYLYVFPTIPTSPDPGLTSRCGWIAKANPPPPVDGLGQIFMETEAAAEAKVSIH